MISFAFLRDIVKSEFAGQRLEIVSEVEPVFKAIHDLLLVVVQGLLAHVQLIGSIVERETFSLGRLALPIVHKDTMVKGSPLIDNINDLFDASFPRSFTARISLNGGIWKREHVENLSDCLLDWVVLLNLEVVSSELAGQIVCSLGWRQQGLKFCKNYKDILTRGPVTQLSVLLWVSSQVSDLIPQKVFRSRLYRRHHEIKGRALGLATTIFLEGR